jgi:hypothetical protein
MKSNRKVNSLMVMVVATLFVLAMAAPAMADRLVTFEGMVTSEGTFEADSGRDFWLYGPHADEIELQAGKKVEIKGLLRENVGNPNKNPSIEVYSYEWAEGMKEMR